MNAIKLIKQLNGTELFLHLPQIFSNKKIEIIILQTEDVEKQQAENKTLNEFQEFKLYRKSTPQISFNLDIDKLINTINNDIF